MCRCLFKNILCVALLQLVLLKGQTGPFETLSVSLGVPRNTNQELFHSIWNIHETLSIAAMTPFYFGTVQVEFRPVLFTATDNSQGDFQALFAHLGWDYSFNLTDQISLYLGGSVGDMFMRFPGEINPHESEFVFGLQGGVRWQFTAHWGGYIDFASEQVKTYHPINFAYLTLGCEYSMDMPEILKKFLDP